MKIQVTFYAQLRDVIGVSKLDVDVAKGTTVDQLLERIYEIKPQLRAHDKGILIGAGVDFVKRDHLLSEEEQIAIMPPVQGG
jgi:molybdopterin synthase sulfur carrier subunit